MSVRLECGGLHAGVLVPPLSKSDAHRALVLAWAAGRELPDLGRAVPVDVQVLQRGLRDLGRVRDIHCEDGGAPFRFLLALAAMEPGLEVALHGSARLGERPHGPLVETLERDVGASVRLGAPWPVLVTGGRAGTRNVRVDARESSQFASALLLGAARRVAQDGLPYGVTLEGAVASRGYLDMTVRWLRLCGWDVTEQDNVLLVKAFFAGRVWPVVPPDWSSMGYLLLVAWASGGVVQVRRDGFEWPHPDRKVLEVMASVGLKCILSSDGIRVRGTLGGALDFDAATAPDLTPTVAALACALRGKTTLRHVDILRGKESDRVEGILDLARAVGATVVVEGDTLTVEGAPTVAGDVAVQCAGDHRRSMSAATLGALLGCNVVLEGRHGVEKSYPEFFDALTAVGVRVIQSS